MRRRGAAGSFETLRQTEAGAALVTALGTVLVLLVIGGALAAQARIHMQAAILERDAAQVQALIASGMNEAAQRAWNDWADFRFASGTNPNDPTYYPDPTKPPGAWAPCDPKANWTGAPDGPWYCVDVLKRSDKRNVTLGDTLRSVWVIPVSIRWQLPNTVPTAVYGWLVVETDASNKVTRVLTYYDHHWCIDAAPAQLCEQGG